jgi:hypothetical protein
LSVGIDPGYAGQSKDAMNAANDWWRAMALGTDLVVRWTGEVVEAQEVGGPGGVKMTVMRR